MIKTFYPMFSRKRKVSKDNKMLIFKQIIRPILTYGCSVFCSVAQIHFKKLQIIQNRCLRLILGCRSTKITDMQENTGILPIEQFILNILEKFYKNCLPEQLREDIFKIYAGNSTDRKHAWLLKGQSIYRH